MANEFRKGDMVLKLYLPHEIPAVWNDLAPLFQKSIDRASNGEYRLEDLHQKLLVGQATACAAYDGSELKVAFVAGVNEYMSGMKAAFMYGLGGSDYRRLFKELFPLFAADLKKNGFSFIECCTGPGMTRYYRGTGFEPAYTMLRYDLGGN